MKTLRFPLLSLRTSLTILLLTASAGIAAAQWSVDPQHTLVIGDGPEGQYQPKIATTPDGGCYISWHDDSPGGADMYMQRLDALGYEQWPHNGLLVADLTMTSYQNYGLATDVAGNALLACCDKIMGIEQIRVCKVTLAGELPWGPKGVQVSHANGEYLSGARVAATTDGGCVVGWSTDAFDKGVYVDLQKLDSNGVPQWGPNGIRLTDEDAWWLMISFIQPAEDGGTIVSWIRQSTTTCGRHLWTQKFSATGAAMWNPNHVPVFDGGLMQNGSFPEFVVDDAGGAVFGWYYFTDDGLRTCAVQHIHADGSEAFPHNGVLGTTELINCEEPSVAYHPATDEIFLFWEEQRPTQPGLYSLRGQKFTNEGTRAWTEAGREIVPPSTSRKFNSLALDLHGDALLQYEDGLTSGGTGPFTTRVNETGATVWNPACTLTGITGGWRMDSTLNIYGSALLAWTNGAKIYAQNVNPDGSLGQYPGDTDGNCQVDIRDLATLLGAYGKSTGEPGFVPGADFDHDGVIDLSDLATVLGNYGTLLQSPEH